MKITVDYYKTKDGKVIVKEWLSKLKDVKAKAQILRRITKIEVEEHFGDTERLREGVFELKIHFGPGYRIYYSKIDGRIVLLLCAGIKKEQDSDICKAIAHLKDYKERVK